MQIYTKKYKIHKRRELLSGLSLLEKAVFSELEDEYLLLYPKGLKGDMSSLYRICSAIGRREKEAVKVVVEMFYTLVDGRFICQLLDAQAEETLTASKKQSDRRNSNKSATKCSNKDTQACPTEQTKLLENNNSQITAVDSTLNSYTSYEVLKEREIDKSISLKKIDPKPPKKKNDYSEEFEKFWAIYPKSEKMEKENSHKKFVNALKIKGVPHENIIAVAGKYAELCRLSKREPEYVTRPQNWLRNELWKNDYDAEIARELERQERESARKNRNSVQQNLPRFSDYIFGGGFGGGEQNSDNGGNPIPMRSIN